MKIKLKPIKNQVIVITGASSGIGLTTARMAARGGARLVLAARNEDAIEQLTREITDRGGEAVYVTADVGREEDVNRIAETAVSRFGGFDTWVNNAGVSIFGLCEQVSIPDMRRMFETNFWGVVYGSRAAVKHFKQRQRPGSLINVGSVFGDRAVVVQSTYCASKHAVHGWTDALRMELEAESAPVSVTLVKPGRIDTPYNEHAQNYMPRVPAHRDMIYLPEAVAEAILFAAQHPKRDMYVGAQAKLGALAGAIAPRLTDKFMESYMFSGQLSADRPADGNGNSALYEPGDGMRERGSNEGALYRRNSYYVKMEKHPVLTTLAITALGAVALMLTRKPHSDGDSTIVQSVDQTLTRDSAMAASASKPL